MVGYELVIRAEKFEDLIEAIPIIKVKLVEGFKVGKEGDVYYDLTKLDELWVTPEALEKGKDKDEKV